MKNSATKVSLVCMVFCYSFGLLWGKAVVEAENDQKDTDEKRFGLNSKGFGSHDGNMVDWNSVVGKRFGNYGTGFGSSDSNMVDWNRAGKRFGQLAKGFGGLKDADMVDWRALGKRGFGQLAKGFGGIKDANMIDWRALGKRGDKRFGNDNSRFGSPDSNMVDWNAMTKKSFGNTGGFGSQDSNMVDWSAIFAKRPMRKRQLDSFNGLGGNSFNNLPFQDWRQSFGRSYRSFGSPNQIHTFGSGLDRNNLQNWGMYNRHARSAEEN